MSGKRINNETLAVSDAQLENVGDFKVPVGIGDGEAHTVTVRQLSKGIGAVVGSGDIPEFSEDTEYRAPEFVLYQKRLWRFTRLHTPGPWIGTDATETSLYGELNKLYGTDSEKVVVTLKSSDGALAVTGRYVYLQIQGDSGPIEYTTGNTGEVTIEVPKGKIYTLTVDDSTNYLPVSPQTFMARQDTRYVTFMYPKVQTDPEVVNVRLMASESDGTVSWEPSIGKNVEITFKDGVTEGLVGEIGSNGWASIEVPAGKEYSVVFPTLTGYTTPQPLSYTSSMRSRVVMPSYVWKLDEWNIKLVMSDGTEYSMEAFDALGDSKPTSGWVALKVNPDILAEADNRVDQSGCGFLLSLDLLTFSGQWASTTSYTVPGIGSFPNATSGSSATDCHYNYCGQFNTESIIAHGISTGYTIAAATGCKGKTITIAGREHQGYLPAFGQLWVVRQQQDVINSWLGRTTKKSINVRSGNWSSSTQYNAALAWYLVNGSPYNGSKTYSYTVLPVFAL